MTRILAGALSALFLAFASMVAQAQDEAPKLELISEILVDPAKQDAFEGNLKGMFSIAKQHGYPYPTYVASWRNTYYIVTPINSYGDLDRVFAARENVMEEGGEAFAMHYQGFENALLNSHSWITHRARDMDYIPEGGMNWPEDNEVVMEIEVFDFKPGHWSEIKDLLSEVKDIYAEVNAPYGYEVYYEGLGTEGTKVTFISFAEDEVALARHNQELRAMLSENEDWSGLVERYLKIALDAHTYHARTRPDLALMPDSEG